MKEKKSGSEKIPKNRYSVWCLFPDGTDAGHFGATAGLQILSHIVDGDGAGLVPPVPCIDQRDPRPVDSICRTVATSPAGMLFVSRRYLTDGKIARRRSRCDVVSIKYIVFRMR